MQVILRASLPGSLAHVNNMKKRSLGNLSMYFSLAHHAAGVFNSVHAPEPELRIFFHHVFLVH